MGRRLLSGTLVLGLAAAVGVALVARADGAAHFATSPLYLVSTVASVVATLAVVRSARRRGLDRLARIDLVLAGCVAAYAAAFASASWWVDIEGRSGWSGRALLVATVVLHLPILTAFQIVPLLVLGDLTGHRPVRLIGGLAGLAAVNVPLVAALFVPYGRFEQHRAWAAGSRFDTPLGNGVMEAVNALFLLVTVAPIIVLALHARRHPGEQRRRLTLAAVTAVVPAGVIILCTLVGVIASAGGIGEDASIVALLVGMNLAVPITGYGFVRASETPLGVTATRITGFAQVVLTGTSALVAVGVLVVVIQAGSGAATLWVALAAFAVVGLVLAGQRRLTRALVVLDESTLATVPAGPVAPPLDVLTRRENEVLHLVAEGLSNAGIADRLVLSQRTVDAHVRSIFAKLDLPSSGSDNRRVQAVLALLRQEEAAS